jgi:hypothetical protein
MYPLSGKGMGARPWGGGGGGQKIIYTIYEYNFNSTACFIIPNCFTIVYTVEQFTFPLQGNIQ